MAKLGGNKRLHEYAVELKGFAAKQDIPYADQFHALLDLWGKNKSLEPLANALPAIKTLAKSDEVAGVEHLRAFLAAQEKSGVLAVAMQGDAVHPGAPGQLMMAAALLKELGAEGFVSSATVDAAKLSADTKSCKITNVKATPSGVSFDRLDESLPFPIPDEARSVLRLYPTILDLSQYTLKVTGLKDGVYVLKVNGATIATLPAKEIEAGVNLTVFGSDPKGKFTNPIAAQGKAVLAAVSVRAGLVGQWRNMSKAAHAPKAPELVQTQLAALTKRVEDADEAIRVAAQPKVLRFELTAK
jgi:hypothetical protein